jgi:hypothetical protein
MFHARLHLKKFQSHMQIYQQKAMLYLSTWPSKKRKKLSLHSNPFKGSEFFVNAKSTLVMGIGTST